MTHTAVIANHKGGVSKSQLTVQLAAALARAGRRVLVVDVDPQANATRRLGLRWDQGADEVVTMSEVIKADAVGVGEQAVNPCGWVNSDGTPTEEAKLIDVLPSRYDIGNRESEAGVVGAVRRIRKALQGWTEAYDVVLIDTPPSIGHLVQMAMAAADVVLIPVAPNYDAAEGAVRIAEFVAEHAVDIANPALRVGGVVVTRNVGQQNEARFQLEAIRRNFGELVWNIAGPITLPSGHEVVNPPYLKEMARTNEADAAAVSLSAWNDADGRTSVAMYNGLARIYAEKFLSGSVDPS